MSLGWARSRSPWRRSLVAWPSFADSDRQYRSLEALAPLVEPGSAIAELGLGPEDPTRTYSLGPAYGRILATRGGRLVYAFTDSAVSPVVLTRRYQWNEMLQRIAFDTWQFSPPHDLKRFRYIFVLTSNPTLQWEAIVVLAVEARLVAQQGEWTLFESKLPLVPLTSSDVLLESPEPDTMRTRVKALIEALRSKPDAPQVETPPEQSPEGGATNVRSL